MDIGQHVRHPRREEWGIGKVLSISGTKATISFSSAGMKTIDAAIVPLTVVEGLQEVPHHIDLAVLERLCHQFISDMEHNRRNVDDAGMAREVLKQMTSRRRLNASTEKRLLDWCYTDGSVFQAGTDLARQICIAIYGRLLPDPDSIKKKSRR